MATKSSLFLLRKINRVFFFVSLAGLISCQSAKKTTPAKAVVKNPPTVSAPIPSENTAVNSSLPEPPKIDIQAPVLPVVAEKPKLGLILGPGAIRSFGHIGVLQTLSQNQIKVQAVAGMEMGSLIAGLYAHKGQGFDVEWQMMKIKEEELVQKSLLGREIKAQSVEKLNGFLQDVFSSEQIGQSKIPFACQSLVVKKGQSFLVSKGAFAQSLPNCINAPPLFYSPEGQSAALFEIKDLVEFLKSKGAQLIVFVNVLESGSGPFTEDMPPTEYLWSQVSDNLSRQMNLFNYVINIKSDNILIADFGKRREMILRGNKAAEAFVKYYFDNWGK